MNRHDTEGHLRAMRDEANSIDPLDIWLWCSLYAISHPGKPMRDAARMARQVFLDNSEIAAS